MSEEAMKRLVAEWLISKAGETPCMRRAAYLSVEALTKEELEGAYNAIKENRVVL